MRNHLDILTKFKEISVCCGADMQEGGLVLLQVWQGCPLRRGAS
jgi:hypothetical protein